MVAAELTLRFVVLSDFEFARAIGRAALAPERLFDPKSESDYWKVRYRLLPAAARRDADSPHPVLGWVPPMVEPKELAHAAEPRLAGRRPVLLYGDSFAACVEEAQDCWQDLLERSELGSTHVLVNYGAGGYGTDQILMAMRATVDRLADQDPFVIVALFVDDDFDRAWIDFRDWPKPRFDLVDGQLALRGPVETDAAEFLDRNPIRPGLLLRRLLLFRDGAPFEEWRRAARARIAEDARKLALNRAILEAAHAELAARDLDHAFLLFHGTASLKHHAAFGVIEAMVQEVAAASDIPCISSRPFLRSAAGPNLVHVDRLFFAEEAPGGGHYNTAGNEVVFQALLQLLRASDGQRELAVARRIGAALAEEGPGCVQPWTVLGRTLVVRYPAGEREAWIRRFPDREGAEHWGLRAPGGSDAPLELRLDPGTSLAARLSVAIGGGAAGEARAELIVRQGDRTIETLELSSNAAPIERAWLPGSDASLRFFLRDLGANSGVETWLRLQSVSTAPTMPSAR